MKNNSMLMWVIVIVVGVGAFFAGTKYQQNKSTNTNSDNQVNGPRGQGVAGRLAGRNGFRPTNGTIIAADEKSITVKLQDGSSKIVLLTDKTLVNKAEKADKSDLKNGVVVGVFGMENTDGSVTAQTIQLNPQFMGERNRPTGTPGQ